MVDELRDLLTESARSPTNAHTYYKSPVLRARKSFGDGTLLNEPLFGDDEAEKLSSVQTRIQRKLDHLKFANVSDSVSIHIL